MFGISVYLKDMDQEYIRKAASYNAKYIFTSLHIPEEDLSNATNQIKELLSYCEKYQLHLVPDVSPVTFEKLNLAQGDFTKLSELGVQSIRLDYGFNDFNYIKDLQENFEIMLNASIINEEFILKCEAHGIDLGKITAVHNFYPKHDTGLAKSYYQKLNKVLVKYKIKILTFVIGDKLKRFPLYEGLPTIEAHRTVHPYVAAVELVRELDSTGVMIGDSMASDFALKAIDDFLVNKIITLPVYLESGAVDFYHQSLRCRRDLSDQIVRVTTPRTSGIKATNNGSRQKGNIILLNELAGRYCGELQLCKADLSFSVEGNTIGFVAPEFLPLLNYLDFEYELRFVPIGG